jgi:hypothetical protein
MEYASFLAGERWSDHPSCTHGLLAGVARDVNDHMSDAGRYRLIPLIPSVIGLNGDDSRIDVGIAARCAVVALPVAAEFRQRALAAGLLAARRVLTCLDDGSGPVFDSVRLCEDIDRALSTAPQQTQWAEQFISEVPVDPKTFRRRSAPSMVRVAVTGIAEACIPDPDILLHELLDAVVADCKRWIGVTPSWAPSHGSPKSEFVTLLRSSDQASSRPSRFS